MNDDLEALPARRAGIADRANPGIIIDVLEKRGLVAGLARHPALRDIFEAHQLRIIAEDHGHIADLLVAAQIDRDPEFDVGSKVEIGRQGLDLISPLVLCGRLAWNAHPASRTSRDEPSARHSPVAYIHGRVRRKWTPG
jgi:hypothetical protein